MICSLRIAKVEGPLAQVHKPTSLFHPMVPVQELRCFIMEALWTWHDPILWLLVVLEVHFRIDPQLLGQPLLHPFLQATGLGSGACHVLFTCRVLVDVAHEVLDDQLAQVENVVQDGLAEHVLRNLVHGVHAPDGLRDGLALRHVGPQTALLELLIPLSLLRGEERVGILLEGGLELQAELPLQGLVGVYIGLQILHEELPKDQNSLVAPDCMKLALDHQPGLQPRNCIHARPLRNCLQLLHICNNRLLHWRAMHSHITHPQRPR
mmetsp:Transcript_45477/g.131666  ORF Transcript_45477/g.131666 Transcript_45477/m.131666 type:complete len:265 (+) Transcript_45477:417-1211(+)